MLISSEQLVSFGFYTPVFVPTSSSSLAAYNPWGSQSQTRLNDWTTDPGLEKRGWCRLESGNLSLLHTPLLQACPAAFLRREARGSQKPAFAYQVVSTQGWKNEVWFLRSPETMPHLQLLLSGLIFSFQISEPFWPLEQSDNMFVLLKTLHFWLFIYRSSRNTSTPIFFSQSWPLPLAQNSSVTQADRGGWGKMVFVYPF